MNVVFLSWLPSICDRETFKDAKCILSLWSAGLGRPFDAIEAGLKDIIRQCYWGYVDMVLAENTGVLLRIPAEKANAYPFLVGKVWRCRCQLYLNSRKINGGQDSVWTCSLKCTAFANDYCRFDLVLGFYKCVSDTIRDFVPQHLHCRSSIVSGNPLAPEAASNMHIVILRFTLYEEFVQSGAWRIVQF